MQKSVAIIYGFAEGPWHAKRMLRQFERYGYKPTNSPEAADVVITHSGGCLFDFKLRPEQTLVVINPVYWPGRSYVSRFRAKVWQDIWLLLFGGHPIYSLQKLGYNLFYAIKYRRRNGYMLRKKDIFKIETIISHSRTILIRNKDDPWLTPDLTPLTQVNPHLRIAELPGGHDDCWLYSEVYLDLIQSDI